MPNLTDSPPDLRTLKGLIHVIRGVIKLLEKRRSAIKWEQYKLRLLRKDVTWKLYTLTTDLGQILDMIRTLGGRLDEEAVIDRNALQADREAKGAEVNACEEALSQKVLLKLPELRNESTCLYHSPKFEKADRGVVVVIQAQIRMAQELHFEFTGRLEGQREAKDLMFGEVFDPAKPGFVEPERAQTRHPSANDRMET